MHTIKQQIFVVSQNPDYQKKVNAALEAGWSVEAVHQSDGSGQWLVVLRQATEQPRKRS